MAYCRGIVSLGNLNQDCVYKKTILDDIIRFRMSGSCLFSKKAMNMR